MIIIYSLPTLFLLTSFSPLSTPLSKTVLFLSLRFFQHLSAPILLYLLLSTAAKISTFFLFPFPLFIITLSTYILSRLPLNPCFSTISHTPLSLLIIPLFCSHLTPHSLSLPLTPHYLSLPTFTHLPPLSHLSLTPTLCHTPLSHPNSLSNTLHLTFPPHYLPLSLPLPFLYPTLLFTLPFLPTPPLFNTYILLSLPPQSHSPFPPLTPTPS